MVSQSLKLDFTQLQSSSTIKFCSLNLEKVVFFFGVFTLSCHSKKLITFSEGVVKLFKIAFLLHLVRIFGQKDALLSNTSLRGEIKTLGFSAQWRLSHSKFIEIIFSFLNSVLYPLVFPELHLQKREVSFIFSLQIPKRCQEVKERPYEAGKDGLIKLCPAPLCLTSAFSLTTYSERINLIYIPFIQGYIIGKKKK